MILHTKGGQGRSASEVAETATFLAWQWLTVLAALLVLWWLAP